MRYDSATEGQSSLGGTSLLWREPRENQFDSDRLDVKKETGGEVVDKIVSGFSELAATQNQVD